MLKVTEIETLARFAACLLADENETKEGALESFTDRDEVIALAKRAWAEIETNGGLLSLNTPCVHCECPEAHR